MNNFTGFAGVGTGFLSSSSSSSHLFFDLPHQPPVTVAMNSVANCANQDNINQFLCPPQLAGNFKDFDPMLDNGGVSLKPQQLSLSLSSHYKNRQEAARGDPMQRSLMPVGPFTGYAAILKGSRFLKPAQQLLEEFCDVGRRVYMDSSEGETSSSAASLGREMEFLIENSISDDSPTGFGDHGERRRLKTRLISMLDEVYRRYKQYYQQLQAVVTSFESVAGLSTAAPYTSLALKALSKHFRFLKNAITEQLHITGKVVNEEGFGKDNARFGVVNQGLRHQKAGHGLSILEQPHTWRPQRGLPERAVSVLRAWLFEHFLHPYPSDADKQMLAKQTGLTRNQVSNWFINARVRLWKPMVEEIHTLELRQAQKASEGENDNGNEQCEPSVAPTLSMDKQPQNTIMQTNQDQPPKRYGNEFAQVPNNCPESMNFSYDNVTGHHGVGVGISLAGGNGGISLTLGLHQNNAVGLSEPLPLTVPHFGLEDSNNAFMMGGYEPQNRRFGRDIGGQLLHDFVG